MAGDLFHFFTFRRAEFRVRARQQVEHRELLLGELFPDVPALFVRQRLTQGQESLTQVFYQAQGVFSDGMPTYGPKATTQG